MEVSDSDLVKLLNRFGHDSFRPGQERVIRDLLSGRDTLAVLPTGLGKSLVFQIASQLLPGATLVVSPLLSLMKDQVDSMEERGVDAGTVNSTLTQAQTQQELAEARGGDTKLLYITPERLRDEEFMATMRRTPVSLLVVDEAHCVSEWGHDFRPAYLEISEAAEKLGCPPILALTATATPWIRREIVERLGMRQPDVVVHGVDRPNLFLEVKRVEEEEEDRQLLKRLLRGEAGYSDSEWNERLASLMQGSGIVYVRTTGAAEETAAWLQKWGVAADFYHGQRRKADRERVQNGFMSGDIRVIVATNAFGLGVDKSDIRFVIHRDVPASVESYYQEAGRAGRDGELARCVLMYRPADLTRAAFLARATRASREDPGDAEERRQAYERSRIAMMRGYAEADDCRRRFILNYFGEESESDKCGQCDNDVRRESGEVVSISTRFKPVAHFEVGDTVIHDRWGSGTVQRVSGDTLTVLFESTGYKSLSSELVQERGLLKKLAA